MSGAEVISPVPEGYGLLHIGPHKTGSTAIQDAMHQARDEMLAQGVRYASARRHDARGARWVTDRMLPGHNQATGQAMWEGVVAAMRDESSPRRVFSSEFLSDATDEQIDAVVEALGGDRLQVAVTLRPLAKILPSQYQQSVHRGTTAAYDPWLHSMLDDPDRPATAWFWRRNRHDQLIARWAQRVGGENLAVVVVDSTDFTMAPRSFEQLLALEPGTLADKKVMANRSYTLPELELVRRFHAQAREAGVTPSRRHKLVLRTSRYVKERTPARDEPRLRTPDWAVDAANRIGAEMAGNIASSGARVIGDLDSLSRSPYDAADGGRDVVIDPDLATRFAVGLCLVPMAVPQAPAPVPERRRRWSLRRR